MTDRTKSALLIGGTLVLGMIVGGLFNAALVNRRFSEVARLRVPGGLAGRIEEVIQPENEEQAEAIRAVLDEFEPRFIAAFDESRTRIRVLTDSVMGELGAVLTEEQMDRLQQDIRVRGEPPPFLRPPRDGTRPGAEKGRRRRPPPGGPPPGGPPPTDTAPSQ